MKLEKHIEKLENRFKTTDDRSVYSKLTKRLIYKIKKKLKKNPKNIELINLCGILALETNDIELSCNMFIRAVHIEANVKTLNNLAYFYLHVYDDSEKAVVFLRKAIDMNPKSEFPYAQLGEAYIDLQQYDKAEYYLKKAAEFNPTLEILNNLGLTVYMQGRVQDSLSHFERALKHRHNTETLLSYGTILAKIGERERAENIAKDLSRILEGFLETGQHIIYAEIGFLEIAELYYEIKNYEMASEYFSKAQKYGVGHYYNMYQYSLIQCQNNIKAEGLCGEFRINKLMELEDIKECRFYSEEEIKYFENKYSREIEVLLEVYEKIKKGYCPEEEFIPRRLSHCYLFGCLRHDN